MVNKRDYTARVDNLPTAEEVAKNSDVHKIEVDAVGLVRMLRFIADDPALDSVPNYSVMMRSLEDVGYDAWDALVEDQA